MLKPSPKTRIRGMHYDAHSIVGTEPIRDVPAIVRKQLKEKGPKVGIGCAWQGVPAPDVGITPVFTARTIEQIGGTPKQICLDPRFTETKRPDPYKTVYWVLVGVVVICVASIRHWL
jgi:hypothetical protein